jgi:hypothetical protein
MELHTIGIDLGKTVFHLVGLKLASWPSIDLGRPPLAMKRWGAT